MASLTDKITDTRNAARPNSAKVSSGRSAGGTTLACDNLTGWPVNSKVHFVTYQIDSNSKPVAGTQLDAEGIVSGSNIGSFTVIDGTDNGNSVGDVVEMLPTAAWGQDLSDGLLVSHNRDGTLKSGAVSSAAILASNVVTSSKISGFDKSNLTTDLNPYKFSAYRNAALNSSSTATKVSFDTESFDTNSNFASGTYTAPVAGFYWFTALAGNTAASATPIFAFLYKNGAVAKRGSGAESAAQGTYSAVSGLLQLAASDTVEVYFVGGAGSTMGVGADKCYFDGFLMSQT